MLKSINFLYFIYGAIFIIGLSPAASETLILLCFGYVGILTHYIKKWSEKVEKNEVYEIRKNVPSIILSVIATTVSILLRNDLINLFVFTRLSSFMVGYFGHSWLFGLIEKKMYSITNPNITSDEQAKQD